MQSISGGGSLRRDRPSRKQVATDPCPFAIASSPQWSRGGSPDDVLGEKLQYGRPSVPTKHNRGMLLSSSPLPIAVQQHRLNPPLPFSCSFCIFSHDRCLLPFVYEVTIIIPGNTRLDPNSIQFSTGQSTLVRLVLVRP